MKDPAQMQKLSEVQLLHLHMTLYTLLPLYLVKFTSISTLNSLLMMSLGAGALKVSRGPNAINREEVSMATLEAGTTPRVASSRHRLTE